MRLIFIKDLHLWECAVSTEFEVDREYQRFLQMAGHSGERTKLAYFELQDPERCLLRLKDPRQLVRGKKDAVVFLIDSSNMDEFMKYN